VKISWDATIDNKKNRMDLDIIARDCNGKCLIVHSLSYEMSLDPVMAEAFAALHAMLMGNELGANEILFE
jgi:hypothetical protein